MTATRYRAAAAVLATAALTSVGAVLPASAPAGPETAAAATATRHVVRPGQTLSSIAQRYGLPYRTLAAYNRIPYPYTVYPDGLLRLTPPSTPPPAFSASVSTVTASQLGATYRAGCPVRPSALRSVRVTRWTFDATASTGVIVVHYTTVNATVATFRRLYAQRFPIRRMVPVSVYQGSDSASMEANNTSAFNCRLVTGSTTRFSEHSYGRAIDVNPVQNPYVRGSTVLPTAGTAYLDRRRYRTGMVHSGGAVAPFRAQGFFWGGSWTTFKDYQHFSTTNR